MTGVAERPVTPPIPYRADARSATAPAQLSLILVALDLNPACDKVVEYVLRLATQLKTSVVLLHVVERPYGNGLLASPLERNAAREGANRRARQKLAELASAWPQGGVRVRSILSNGLPEFEILRLAETLGADLIVLGRSQRNAFSRLFFGATTAAVVESARCPVLVVPE